VVVAYQCHCEDDQEAAVGHVPQEGDPDAVVALPLQDVLDELVLPLHHEPNKLAQQYSKGASDDPSGNGDDELG
jgi:hypothetical protein